MLQLVTNATQVKKLYAEFRSLLQNRTVFSEHLASFHLGHLGGASATVAEYAPAAALRIWASPGNLQWNAFGVEKIPSMVVQINFQDYDSKPRRIGAAFAVDANNNPVVIHRGHIGGGRPGVGLGLMLKECRAERVALREEDGQESECFVVGQLRSKFFARQLAIFIREVHRVKASSGDVPISGIAPSLLRFEEKTFTQEKAGNSLRTVAGTVDLTHGVVVNELATQLKRWIGRRSWNIASDRHRDLLLSSGPDICALFEVKTVVSTQSICTALGQLLLYSTTLTDASLIMVLPEKLPSEVVAHLRKWNIQMLYYTWAGTTPRFQSLNKLLDSIEDRVHQFATSPDTVSTSLHSA